MKKRDVGVLLMAVALMVVISGCATIASGTTQKITIDSNPPGAMVRIGQHTGTTPVTMRIPKGRNWPIEISHGKDKRLVQMHRRVDAMTFLNFIPPLWPGFIVDVVTGAITKYDADVINLDFGTNEYQLTRSRH